MCAAAQTPTEPPALIQVVRKPGIETRWLKPYSDAGAQVNVLGLSAITGLQETWQVELHNSFSSIEDLDRAMGMGAGRNDALTLIAIYRPDWGYRADEAVRLLTRARYFQATIFRVGPGSESAFGEMLRRRTRGLDRINIDRPDLGYQVVSGAPSGMAIFLAPLVSLKVIDDAIAKLPAQVEGAPKESGGEISREGVLLRVEPKLSWVSDDFADSDTEFWRGKPRSR